jgi:hypothetical protein
MKIPLCSRATSLRNKLDFEGVINDLSPCGLICVHIFLTFNISYALLNGVIPAKTGTNESGNPGRQRNKKFFQ